MLRFVWLFWLGGALVWGAGCNCCANGPSFTERTTLDAQVGRPIDARLPLHPPSAVASGAAFRFTQATDLPAGLSVAIEGDQLHLSGSVESAGSQTFVVLLQEEQNNVCAPWARYDITLNVAVP